jgi:hypothetical protein
MVDAKESVEGDEDSDRHGHHSAQRRSCLFGFVRAMRHNYERAVTVIA